MVKPGFFSRDSAYQLACAALAAAMLLPSGVQAQTSSHTDRLGNAVRNIPAPQAARMVDGWDLVDSLKPGTRVVLTLTTGERRSGRLARTTAEDIVLWVGGSEVVRREETVLKSRVQTVVRDDPVKDGLQVGGAIGAAAMVSMVQMASHACGLGCENDLPSAMPFLVGGMGAGIGAAAGFLVDRFQDRSDTLFPASASRRKPDLTRDRVFPTPSVRVGPAYRQILERSTALEGTAPSAGVDIAGQIAPYVSLHAEFMSAKKRFVPAAGAVPEIVLQNLVPASSRSAGWSRGIESRRLTFVYSELVGVHPPAWSRVRVELLAGITIIGRERSDYYDAYADYGRGTIDDPHGAVRIPGKYYVLNFESPGAGFVYGADAQIAVKSGLELVPTVRYHHVSDPGPLLAYGVAARWRF